MKKIIISNSHYSHLWDIIDDYKYNNIEYDTGNQVYEIDIIEAYSVIIDQVKQMYQDEQNQKFDLPQNTIIEIPKNLSKNLLEVSFLNKMLSRDIKKLIAQHIYKELKRTAPTPSVLAAAEKAAADKAAAEKAAAEKAEKAAADKAAEFGEALDAKQISQGDLSTVLKQFINTDTGSMFISEIIKTQEPHDDTKKKGTSKSELSTIMAKLTQFNVVITDKTIGIEFKNFLQTSVKVGVGGGGVLLIGGALPNNISLTLLILGSILIPISKKK